MGTDSAISYPETAEEFNVLFERVSLATKLQLNKREFTPEEARGLYADLELLARCVKSFQFGSNTLLNQFMVFFILHGEVLLFSLETQE